MQPNAETDRLESIATKSLYAHWVNSATIQASFHVFSTFLKSGPTLELGPAEGVMTNFLVKTCDQLTVVDGSEHFCAAIKSRHPNITVVNSLFESFEPQQRFSNIILGHVLEHVDDPVAILKRASNWLSPSGRILAAVPNSRSLHRQAAVLMGLLPYEESLNEADHHHGHRRVYNPELFRRDFLSAGLSIERFGGYWLKPVSNSQIEMHWTPQMLNAFMALGERYPDIAGEIYIVARNEVPTPYFDADWRQQGQQWQPRA
jgi:2-polyprenyl-3-methyl-5-hydroxy-6-metoxy-1,4-benzoquinol methylase